jgi:ubiquinone biosynthesis protein UbiJ
MVLETPFAAALNHLLRAESWAREALAPFAGETLELRAPPLPSLKLAIAPEGTVVPAPAGAATSLTVTLKPGLAAALLQGQDHVLREVEVSGNARLADAILLLVRHLRWDAEEDLSRVVGDVAAHRLVQAGRDVAAWQRDTAQRLAESFSDYLAEEKRVLVRSAELEQLARSVAALRDGLERLGKRVERLK